MAMNAIPMDRAQGQVGTERRVDRVHLQADVGGDEPDAGQHRQDEARGDDAFGGLRRGRIVRPVRQLAGPSVLAWPAGFGEQSTGLGGRWGPDHPPGRPGLFMLPGPLTRLAHGERGGQVQSRS